MSVNPKDLLLQTSPLAQRIVDFYAAQYGRDNDAICDKIIKYFLQRDLDVDESKRETLADAAAILAFYSERFSRSPNDILDTILVEFTRYDPDFNPTAFATTLSDIERAEARARLNIESDEMPSRTEHACPISGAKDAFALRELGDHARIDRWFQDKVTEYRCPMEIGDDQKALRGIHARGLGTLRGHLTLATSELPTGLPKDLQRFGIFANTGATFDVILRYSTSGGPKFEAMPDSDEEQAIGLGLKILTDTEETAHDLLFINSPIFMTNDPVALVFQEDASALRTSYAAARDVAVQDVLAETQYTAAAFAWGSERAVKYRLRPNRAPRGYLEESGLQAYDTQLSEKGARCLEERIKLVLQHAGESLTFQLEVQFSDPNHAESHGSPVDDERIAWKTPWLTLGQVKLPPQDIDHDEAIAFHPFHVSDAGLLPLGRLNRARLTSYRRSRETRHEINEVEATPYPYQVPASLKVAVIGGGASGLAASLALASFGYQVEVFERNAHLGGHACAKDVFDGKHRRDPAFGAFRERQWPNLWKLLEELEVKPLSHGKALDWFESPFAGWFAQDGHPIERSPEVLETMQAVVLAFTRAIREPSADDRTVGELFDELGVSSEFLLKGFLGGIVHYFAGHPIQTYLDYPLRLLAWMWLNNADRQDDEPIELFQVDNDTYITQFANRLSNLGVQIHTGVETVVKTRDTQSVTIEVRDDSSEDRTFAQAILAVQPHHALTILGDTATEAETALLGQFKHSVDTVVIHRDNERAPPHADQWKLFNVQLPNQDAPPPDPSETLPITIVKPCTRDRETPIFALYDYAHADDATLEGERFTFDHLRVTPHTQRLRRDLPTLQGAASVYFCGSWSRGLTLHEDAIVTGFQAANQLLGGLQSYPILDPPVPLPEPFGELRASKSAPLGQDRGSILAALEEMLRSILPSHTSFDIDEDTELQGLVTSSLHLARLATALSARMQDPDAVDISELMHLETIGELIDFIAMAQDEMGEVPRETGAETTAHVSLPPSAWTGQEHPVTMAQQNILTSQFLSREKNGEWNIAVARWLDGAIETQHLEGALIDLVTQHSALRTKFHRKGPRAFTQEILSKLPPTSFFEFPAASDEEARLLAKAQVDAPIDITEGVLRVRVIRRSPSRVLLLIVVHHAVSDGWTVGLMMESYWRKLRQRLELDHDIGTGAPSLPPQQIDAAYWEEQDLAAGRWESAVSYWKSILARPLPKLKAPKSLRARAFRHSFVLSAERLNGLREVAKAHKTSLNVLLLELYARTLGQVPDLVQADELLVRIPIAARSPSTEPIVGSFADALALRVPCRHPSMPVSIQATHQALYEGLANQAPYSLLWGELQWSPAELIELNQVILNLEQTIAIRDDGAPLGSAFEVEAIADESDGPAYTTVRSMLSLNASAHGTFLGQWLWSSELADETNGQRYLIDRFQSLIDDVLKTGATQERAPAEMPVVQPASDARQCPFHDAQRNLKTEERAIQSLVERYDAQSETPKNPDDDVHIGEVVGHFNTTTEGRGIFERRNATLDVTLRYSTRFGAGGLGLKMHQDGKTLHDLLFLTTTTMPNDPVKLVDAAGSNEDLSASDAMLQPYYSISAYGWSNEHAVKYRLEPSVDMRAENLLSDIHLDAYQALEERCAHDPRARSERLTLLLKHAEASITLSLSIQRATHPDRTPVDDTLVEWQESYEEVAIIEIPPQQARLEHDETLRFQPYHVSDEGFLPLGRLNRFRQAIYAHTQRSSKPRYPYDAPLNTRAAVVGGGASGLRAALALASQGYKVAIYERSSSLGGHASTKDVLDGKHRREPAFGAFRAAQWPNLMSLLEMLDVQAHSHGQSQDWLDSPFVGWWRGTEGWVQPSSETEEEAKRFIGALVKTLYNPAADGETIGEFIDRLGLSNQFLTTWFAGGVIHYFAGQPLEYYLSYPTRLLAWMWLNNAERKADEPIELLKVDNDVYVEALREALEARGVDIYTDTSVTIQERSKTKIKLVVTRADNTVESHEVGHLILAIQPQHCLSVLDDKATMEEREVLGGFRHTVDIVRIHRESPINPAPDKLLTIVLPDSDEELKRSDTLPMVITKTCERDKTTPIYATYDYAATRAFEGPDTFPFEHVQVTPDTQRLRRRLKTLQGEESVYFCGSWSRGLTLHEDALVSALECVNRILGPSKSIEILAPPLLMPEPFEDMVQTSDASALGSNATEVMASIIEIVETVLDSKLPVSLNEETALSDIQLSSLHFARLANAIGSRLPDALRDEVDILVLLEMETLGELAHFLTVLVEEQQATQPARPIIEPQNIVHDPPRVTLSLAEAEASERVEQASAPVQTSKNPSRRAFIDSLPKSDERRFERAKSQGVQAVGLIGFGLTLALCSRLAFNAFESAIALGVLGLVTALPAAYGVFTLAYSAMVIIVKATVVGRLEPGRYPLYGNTHLRWWIGNLFMRFGQQTIWAPLGRSGLGRWLIRSFGARIGIKTTIPIGGSIPSFSLIDADLLSIGTDVYIRPNGAVRAHLFVDGELVLAQTSLDDQAVVWSRALVEPGATMGQSSYLEAGAILSMGHQLRDGGLGDGAPAEALRDRIAPKAPTLHPLEETTYFVAGIAVWPTLLGLSVLAPLSILHGLLPGFANLLVVPLLYPLWVLSGLGLGFLTSFIKTTLLDELAAEKAEEDHPIALPLTQSFVAALGSMSWLWPRRQRRLLTRWLGAGTHEQLVTDEAFVDLTYADLLTRENGTFFSSAAFIDFARLENGKRILYPVELKTGSYVGAYASLQAPLTLSDNTLVAACSRLPLDQPEPESGAWVGAPARRVALKSDEVAPHTFSLSKEDLSRLSTRADIHRFALFTLVTGAVGLLATFAPSSGVLSILEVFLLISAGYFTVLGGFALLVRHEAQRLRRAVREELELQSNGIGRAHPLISRWAANLFHMAPLGLLTEPLSGTTWKLSVLRLIGSDIDGSVYLANAVGLSDLPYIEIGPQVVVNEGAALIAHSELPNGNVSFKKLILEHRSSVLWSSYLTGGAHLPEGSILGSAARPFDGQELEAECEYDNTPCRKRT